MSKTWKIIGGALAALLLLKPGKSSAAKSPPAPGANVPAGLTVDREGQRYILDDRALDTGGVLDPDSINPGTDTQPPTGDVVWASDGKRQTYIMIGARPSEWRPSGVLR